MAEQASILIVDDDPSLTRTTSLILGHKGYVVTTARNGAEAIEKTQETAFDLTFIDIKMPGIDGVETLRRVRRLRPAVTVVMMTAYAINDRGQETLQERGHGILYKPFDIEEFLRFIKRAIIDFLFLEIALLTSYPCGRVHLR